MQSKKRVYQIGHGVSTMGFPKLDVQWNHVDGPMLHSSECVPIFLSWKERFGLWTGLLTIEQIDANHRIDKYRFNVGDVVRHVKTNGLYLIEHLPNTTMIESTGDPAYVYRELNGFTRFVRPREIMEDGRFEKCEETDNGNPLYS